MSAASTAAYCHSDQGNSRPPESKSLNPTALTSYVIPNAAKAINLGVPHVYFFAAGGLGGPAGPDLKLGSIAA